MDYYYKSKLNLLLKASENYKKLFAVSYQINCDKVYKSLKHISKLFESISYTTNYAILQDLEDKFIKNFPSLPSDYHHPPRTMFRHCQNLDKIQNVLEKIITVYNDNIKKYIRDKEERIPKEFSVQARKSAISLDLKNDEHTPKYVKKEKKTTWNSLHFLKKKSDNYRILPN